MYKRNFKDRSEAFQYTMQRVCTAKSRKALMNNYVNAIKVLPITFSRAQVIAYTEENYSAFNVVIGDAKFNEIIIHEDGEISI